MAATGPFDQNEPIDPTAGRLVSSIGRTLNATLDLGVSSPVSRQSVAHPAILVAI
jgi:hypothetical protein